MIRWALNKALRFPLLFEIQQRLCNDYNRVRLVFEPELSSSQGMILDIGCSTGACGRSLTEGIGRSDYLGIDIDLSYLASGKRYSPKMQYAAMDASMLALPNNFFDLVLFSGVLHHMNDKLAKNSIKEAARVLQIEGCVLIAEPVFTPSRYLSNVLLTFDRGNYIRDARGYIALLNEFTIERQGFFLSPPHRFFFVFAEDKVNNFFKR